MRRALVLLFVFSFLTLVHSDSTEARGKKKSRKSIQVGGRKVKSGKGFSIALVGNKVEYTKVTEKSCPCARLMVLSAGTHHAGRPGLSAKGSGISVKQKELSDKGAIACPLPKKKPGSGVTLSAEGLIAVVFIAKGESCETPGGQLIVRAPKSGTINALSNLVVLEGEDAFAPEKGK